MFPFNKLKKKALQASKEEQAFSLPHQPTSSRLMLALEPRYLYDGAGLITGLESVPEPEPLESAPTTEPESSASPAPTDEQNAEGPSAEDSNQQEQPTEQTGSQEETDPDNTPEPETSSERDPVALPPFTIDPIEPRTEIVFIDSGVEDAQALSQELSQYSEVYILESDRDGVEQINDLLNRHEDVDALHIFSHGSSGSINLGNSKLTNDNLDDYHNLLQDWGNSLAAEGDILLYGCHVGSGENGTDFITRLSEFTGADIAASDDSTGSGTGENWNLENSAGPIDSTLINNVDFSNTSISLTTSETEVTLDAAGNLVIIDINDTDTWDNLTLSTDDNYIFIVDPGNILTTSIVGATGAGSNQITVSLGTTGFTGGIIVNTLGGDDLFTIDFTAGNFTRDITYNGGENDTADGDVMELVGGHFADPIYTFDNAHDGSINLDGLVISYTGIEPLTSTVTATDVTLSYGNADETITITDAGGGQTTVNSTAGEIITFNNPTGSLTINAGSGNDTINLNSLGNGFAADLTINGQGGNDEINIKSLGGNFAGSLIVNGQSGNDFVKLSNGLGTNINVNGGDGDGDKIQVMYSDVTVSDTGASGSAAWEIGTTSGTDTWSGFEVVGILGTNGNDSIELDNTAVVDVAHGLNGNDTITNRGTVLNTYSTHGIFGGGGDDEIHNYGTTGQIEGNTGHDEVHLYQTSVAGTVSGGLNTGAGSGDILAGHYNNVTVSGTAANGSAIWDAGAGTDTWSGFEVVGILGTTGHDTIVLDNTTVVDLVHGQNGDDTITNYGTVLDSFSLNGLVGGGGNDLIHNYGTTGKIAGNTGHDEVHLYQGSISGTVTGGLNTGAGVGDVLVGHYTSVKVFGTAASGSAIWTNGTSGTDTWSGFEAVDLYGNSDNNKITIKSGAEVNNVYGEDGDDTIMNSGTVNNIYGGKNADSIDNMGTVNNTISGGKGADVIRSNGTVTDINGDNGNDSITVGAKGTVTNVSGGDGNDSITNNGSIKRELYGNNDHDTITIGTKGTASEVYGGRGNDTIINHGTVTGIDGGKGDDQVYFLGGTVKEGISGDERNETSGDILYLTTLTTAVVGTADNGKAKSPNDSNIFWNNFESLALWGTDGDDRITIDGNAAIDYVYGNGGNDTLTIDFSNGPITNTINYDGGSENVGHGNVGDTLKLTGGKFKDVTYNFDNLHDGSINLDGLMINYTDLEPITSHILAKNVTLNYSNADETITITKSSHGRTTVNSTAGEVVTFINPNKSLTINGGGGKDTIKLKSLDKNFQTDLTINGQKGNDTITVAKDISTKGDITIKGSDGKDTITNKGKITQILGGDDKDTIVNHGKVKFIDGGKGNDSIINKGYVTNKIDGGNGDDTIKNNSDGFIGKLNDKSNGSIIGGSGDDRITNQGYVGNKINAGDGQDTIINSGKGYVENEINGGDDKDKIINKDKGDVGALLGGKGKDTIINQAYVFDIIDGGAGNDIITNNGLAWYIEGGKGDDNIVNKGKVFEICGGEDNDIITNKNKVGFINGWTGDDIITNTAAGKVLTNIIGGTGKDSITNAGTVGNNIMGNKGSDTITNTGNGLVKNDILGGGGNDTILNKGIVKDDIEGNNGNDTILNKGVVKDDIEGNDGNDSLTNKGKIGEDLEGGSGDDTITNKGLVVDDLEGNDGNDTILNKGVVKDDVEGNDGNDSLINKGKIGEDLEGGSGDDTIINKGTVKQFIDGGDDNDTITNTNPKASAEAIFGGSGDDTISFYQGSVDSKTEVDVDGGTGTDSLNAHYNIGTISGDSSGQVTSGTGIHSGGTDVWDNFETVNIKGTKGDDNLTVDRTATVNNLYARKGNDEVTVFQGTVLNTINGGKGTDTLNGTYVHATITGTPAKGSATYRDPNSANSPDNWINFEGFNLFGLEANDDSNITTSEDSLVSINVFDNDKEYQGGVLKVSSYDSSSAGGGIVTYNGNGIFSYDPNGMFDYLNDGETATDTFTYTITNGDDIYDTATVTITITGVSPQAAARGANPGTPQLQSTPQPQSTPQNNGSNLYLPGNPEFTPSQFTGNPYTPGQGSLVQSMLNSITGSIADNLGSGKGTPGSNSQGGDAQPYTPPEEENNQTPDGNNDGVSTQDGPDNQNQGSEEDEDSRKKRLLEEEENNNNNNNNNNTGIINPDTFGHGHVTDTTEPMIFPEGFMAEVHQAGNQFETQRFALLSAVQEVAAEQAL